MKKYEIFVFLYWRIKKNILTWYVKKLFSKIFLIKIKFFFNPLVTKRWNTTAVPPGRWIKVFVLYIHPQPPPRACRGYPDILIYKHGAISDNNDHIICLFVCFFVKSHPVEFHRIGTKWTFNYRPLVTNGLKLLKFQWSF